MKRALMTLTLALVAGVAPTVYAQGTTKASAKTADDPEASSIGTGSASRIVLEAGDANSKATARLAGRFGGEGDVDGRYAFTVNAPFDRNKADHVDVGSLSGLTAGTSATLELGLRWWRSPVEAKDDKDKMAAMSAVCEEYYPQVIPGYSQCDLTTVAAANCDAYAFDPKQLKALVNRIEEKRKSCAKCRVIQGEEPPVCKSLLDARRQSCTPGAVPAGDPAVCALLEKEIRDECTVCKEVSAEGEDKVCPADKSKKPDLSGKAEDIVCRILAKHGEPAAVTTNPEILKKAMNAARPLAEELLTSLTMFTVGLTGNTQQFTYLLEDNLDKVYKNDKEGVGITLAATHVLLRSAWTLGYSHEESYKGTDKIQLCRPLGTTGASTCTAASLGAPKKEKAEIAFLQNRVAFADGHFALAPRVEFDFKKSEWAARVPFYFIANKSHELTAGVAVGYTEVDDEGFGATVFISKAFTFY